jgi:5'-methylthioadenosine phosphorylase
MIGIIGGSGLYQINGLENVQEKSVKTPFGEPSSPIVQGKIAGKDVAFLARHGKSHQFTPSEVNYRANIYAMKSLGVKRIIGVSACGSLREDYAPGSLVIPNQLIDMTKGRKRSFFEQGVVAHVGVADPFCETECQALADAAANLEVDLHKGGAFVTVEGPRFSTRGESELFRSWGMALIGMTTSPEAFLAREAEICYAVLAHVTDYDVWHTEPVSVELVVKTMQDNIKHAKTVIRNYVANTLEECTCEHQHSLENALLSNLSNAPAETLNKLDLLIGKYLKS